MNASFRFSNYDRVSGNPPLISLNPHPPITMGIIWLWTNTHSLQEELYPRPHQLRFQFRDSWRYPEGKATKALDKTRERGSWCNSEWICLHSKWRELTRRKLYVVGYWKLADNCNNVRRHWFPINVLYDVPRNKLKIADMTSFAIGYRNLIGGSHETYPPGHTPCRIL